MKKILITGANSYIGTSFEKYMKQYSEYQVDTLDMQNPNWKDYDFTGYDSVFHVAGIAHQKETNENAHLYYDVNRDLAIETAKYAKEKGVKLFVFMSSMSVYGLEYSNELITVDTIKKPITNYGKSKLEAENSITELENDSFKVAVIRPPMVYGEGCPGNLTKLFKAVRKIHVFPTIKNERSSITVDKLSKEIFTIISRRNSGVFLPQNNHYMCTYETVKEQMSKENIKVLYLSFFNPIIKILIGKKSLINKVFGDLKYEK